MRLGGGGSLLVGAMVFAVAAIAGLAYWDDVRESEAALEDFAEHQSVAASLIAQHLEARLGAVSKDARIAARDGSAAGDRGSGVTVRTGGALSIRVGSIELEVELRELIVIGRDHRERSIVLVAPPGGELMTDEGRIVSFPEIARALRDGRAWSRVTREQALRVGLPERTGAAGLAIADAGPLGRWGIAVVASAERERDREQRARLRLLLAVLSAAGLVLSFGGLALAKQRRELELKRQLEVSERDERLKNLDKAVTLGTMAIGIAHEVSTPLGVISGRAEQLLSKVEGDERTGRALQSIIDATRRISEVIRAFLGIARGDPPPIQRIAPAAIIDRAKTLVEHRFQKAGIELAHDVPGQLPEVEGDRVLLEQALVNLLLNACEACDRGGHVSVTACAEGGAVTFIVLDDGSGISTADAARVAEPFFTTKAAKGGSGLGLAIVSEIVEHHRGKLILTPRSGRGTEARIEIPVSTPPIETPPGRV